MRKPLIRSKERKVLMENDLKYNSRIFSPSFSSLFIVFILREQEKK